MDRGLVCYCFGYSGTDVVKDALESKGASSILDRILSEKNKRECNWRHSHPEDR